MSIPWKNDYRMLNDPRHPTTDAPHPFRGWAWLITIAALLLLLLALFPRGQNSGGSTESIAGTLAALSDEPDSAPPVQRRARLGKPASEPEPAFTAEQIVAGKVLQFGRSRREIVRSIARKTGKEIPPEVERFFDALEAGNWKEIDAQGRALGKRSGQYEGSTNWAELNPFWPAVLDAYGVAEQAHMWPAQKLLDYGNSILDSLRPGMVYVGGTDPGRWIPELLNETSGREPHIIVTQNAFADARYLDYMSELYGERFAALNMEDSKRAFDEYVADARRRWEHDQQFPDGPRQVRDGEKLTMEDGKFQVSGQVAVMAINEKMLHMLMDKNPGLSFAIEQSFAFQSTYGNATPVGPIMELRVQDEQQALTRQRAAESVDYWRSAVQGVLGDAQGADSYPARLSFAKLAAEQAELLRSRQFGAEAEQTFRLALELAPASADAVFRYVALLEEQQRYADAIAVAERAIRAGPETAQWQEANRERVQQTTRRFQDLVSRLRGNTR